MVVSDLRSMGYNNSSINAFSEEEIIKILEKRLEHYESVLNGKNKIKYWK